MGKSFFYVCKFAPHIHFPSNVPKMELLKDGNPFYQWTARHSWHYYYSTPSYSAKQNHTGEYKCKGTIGAASRYSSPSYLTVGGKFHSRRQILFYCNMVVREIPLVKQNCAGMHVQCENEPITCLD